jgi:hypothetical protein
VDRIRRTDEHAGHVILSALRRLAVVVLLLVLVLEGCGPGGERPPAVVPLPVMSAASLRAVPVTASLDLPVQASVYAWRDFMPAVTDSARPHDLRVSVQVRGGVVPPKTLGCAGIYLVHGDSVVASPPAEQRPGDGPGAVECLLRGGPEWPVGAELHVIISVTAGAQRALIRRETTIDATS